MKHMLRIIRDLLLTALILLFFGLVVVRLNGPQEAASGRARVVDGDTLVLDGRRIRLVGIDAPELRQVCQRDGRDWPCGTEARAYLSGLTGEAKTTCEADGSDRYGRLLAVCRAQNIDLNAAMVAAGYAIAFGDYEAEQGVARQKRLGLWAGTFAAPRIWRQTHGGMDEKPHIPDGWLEKAISRIGNGIETVVSRAWND
ncbi:thermonuclease family protein [Pararhizobium sp. YC-54]|uniref:thermonuclease family protein n=1 Tax=Pararhizobium sp. YC-54 TaxID=2986920 RepID=UPI0021F7BF31|nr:thermonuclease family protein [Pararhizobium sp. YC-54]MCV9996779.1 thermonuclease family protein [Pararhizobium sp. YC-54]